MTEVARAARAAASKVQLVATLDSLEHLSHERILNAGAIPRVKDARLHVAALSALDADPADQLLTRIRAETDEIATAFIASFSAVMIAHTGPGLVGLSWWWEPRSALS